MEEDLGEEWVVVPREKGESSKGKADEGQGMRSEPAKSSKDKKDD